MPERCVHTQTAGRGRRRLTPGGGDTHGAVSHPPLHAAPSPCSRLPPNPNPANSRKPNSQRRPDEGLGPPLVFQRQRRDIPNSDARSLGHLLQKHSGSAPGPPAPQTSAADRATAPCPPSPTTAVRDSHLLFVQKNPSRSPPRPRSGHSPPRAQLFRAGQLNPRSAGRIYSPGPIPPRRQE